MLQYGFKPQKDEEEYKGKILGQPDSDKKKETPKDAGKETEKKEEPYVLGHGAQRAEHYWAWRYIQCARWCWVGLSRSYSIRCTATQTYTMPRWFGTLLIIGIIWISSYLSAWACRRRVMRLRQACLPTRQVPPDNSVFCSRPDMPLTPEAKDIILNYLKDGNRGYGAAIHQPHVQGTSQYDSSKIIGGRWIWIQWRTKKWSSPKKCNRLLRLFDNLYWR